MKEAVLLLSGGIDSTTLLYHVQNVIGVQRVHALSFLYGQKHAKEVEMAKWQASNADVSGHEIIDITFLKQLLQGSSALTDESIAVPELDSVPDSERDQPVTYVPNRNMVLLSLAAARAEALGIEDLFYGAQAQDEYGYWDCTGEFLNGINAVLSLNRRKAVHVHAPFLAQSKGEIVSMGEKLGVDYAHTWSCYCGEDTPCGTCPTCVERANAFASAGIEDPLG
jgi:7-cyano-7-deazaguanine synthase